MMKNNQQKGTALISALLITAIAAVIATAVIVSLQMLIRESQLIVNSDVMTLDLQGVTDWAEMTILGNSDIKKIKSLQLRINGTTIRGKISAQQGLFNLNSLVNAGNETRFIHLLQAVLPNESIQHVTVLAKVIQYRAAHRPFVLINELRAVDGVTAPIYRTLSPYISALPPDHYQIDINAASIPVLGALTDTITPTQARALHACREGHGEFSTVDEFMHACGAITPLNPSNITTVEDYYLVEGSAFRNEQQLIMVSLLQKYTASDNKVYVRVVWEQW